MSTAAAGVEGGGGAAEGEGGGGGQLGSIKSEGYGSQLAPAGLDCHLAQINRELSGLFENIGILRGILRIFF